MGQNNHLIDSGTLYIMVTASYAAIVGVSTNSIVNIILGVTLFNILIFFNFLLVGNLTEVVKKQREYNSSDAWKISAFGVLIAQLLVVSGYLSPLLFMSSTMILVVTSTGLVFTGLLSSLDALRREGDKTTGVEFFEFQWANNYALDLKSAIKNTITILPKKFDSFVSLFWKWVKEMKSLNNK